MQKKLTQFTQHGGCAAKASLKTLTRFLSDLDKEQRSAGHQSLINLTSKPDAGVYQLNEKLILIQNVDFITPIVDAPFEFGAIAAANAFSDIYAMGGTPITALNILAYPNYKLEQEVATTVLKGGFAKIKEAGALLIGGHTTDNPEIVYGLSVTGIIPPDRLIKNSTAQPGDVLILSKPVGSTLVSIAFAQEVPFVDSAILNEAIESMSLLNNHAAEAAQKIGVNACTDVTGFGFWGHLWELCSASQVGAIIEIDRIRHSTCSYRLATYGLTSRGHRHNREYIFSKNAIDQSPGIDIGKMELLFETETSGGLLLSTPASKAQALVDEINRRQKNNYAHIVGQIVDGSPRIHVI